MTFRVASAQLLRRPASRFRRSNNRIRRRRRANFFKPLVQQLEDRRVLSLTFSVNSTADKIDLNPGDGIVDTGTPNEVTLRAAVMEANAFPGADTIRLPSGTYSLSGDPLEDFAVTGDLDITDDLTIIGDGAGMTIVDAAGKDRAFHVYVAVASLSGISIMGGVATDAGTSGAFGDGYGGGILNEFGTMTLTDVIISGNQAVGGSGGGQGLGGGIYSFVGTGSIIGSTISGNQALGVNGGAGLGGGIYSDFTTWEALDRSTLSGNVARGGSGSEGAGGGLAAGGGVFSISSTWDSVTGITLSQNQAIAGDVNGGPGGDALGGGILSGFGDTWRIAQSTLAENTAIGGNGGPGKAGGTSFGGAIYATGNTLRIEKSTLSNNTAAGGDGGNNVATGAGGSGGHGLGGGLYADEQADVVFQNATLSANRAVGGAGGKGDPGGAGGDGKGGALFAARQSGVTTFHVTVTLNEAVSGLGGSDGTNGVGVAGGILSESVAAGVGTVSLKSTIVAKNIASTTNRDVFGEFESQGFNLIGDATGGSGFTAGEHLGTTAEPVDPVLGPLQNNGGPTLTHALLPGSPAIDTADADRFLLTDQRGVARPMDGNNIHPPVPDIGAFEFISPISGFVYRDSNSNGIKDAGEAGLANVSVTLTGIGGIGDDIGPMEPITVTTDSSGYYEFINQSLTPLPGTYAISEMQPAGYGDGFETKDNVTPLAGSAGGPDEIAGLIVPGHVPASNNFGELRSEVHVEKFTRIDVIPIDIEKLVRVETPGIAGNLCEVFGKPAALTFKYVVGDTVNTNQSAGKAAIITNNGADDDGVSFIIVTDQSNALSALSGSGKQFFRGEAAFDAVFQATASFGADTYIHFFDDGTGHLLQTVKYHTSCSQPIQLQDSIGNATLIGYVGASGAAELPNLGPGIGDADADWPTGPAASFGDTVVFTYVVTNSFPGTALSNVVVRDEILFPAMGTAIVNPVLDGMGVNVGDDGDELLEFGEAWLYTSTVAITQATPLGQHIGQATVMATTEAGGMAMDKDLAHFVVSPPLVGELCGGLGKPVALTFQYIPGTTVDTDQDVGKAAILFRGGVDDDGISFMVVTDQSNASTALSGSGKQFFRGDVAFDELFQASKGATTFGSSTYIHFFDDSAGGLLQTITYHTSCSQPIQLGDVVGNAKLVAYTGEIGSAALPSPPADPPELDIGGIVLTTDVPFDPMNIGADADHPTGPIAHIGDKVTHTYAVSNPGGAPLTIINLFDDHETPDFPPGMGSDDFEPVPVLKANGKNFGDINDDGFLDSNEVWHFQVVFLATQPGQHTGWAKVTAEDRLGNLVTDDDPSNYMVNPLAVEKFVVPPAVVGGDDVCTTLGKPLELTFEYQRSNDFYSMQPASKALIVVNNGPDDDRSAYVAVSNSSSPGSGTIFFQGVVNEGETFKAVGGFGSNTFLYFFDFQGGPLLQQVQYHTSCSAPIVLGAQLLSGVLVGYVGQTGAQTITAPGLGDPADTPTGPTFLSGDQVVFNYKITNAGNVGLTNVVLTDSVPGTVPHFLDKGNGDDILDAGETWILTAGTTAAGLGQQTTLGTVSANSVQDPTGATMSASDPAYYFIESLKFFVVDKSDKATYTYTDGGNSIGSFVLDKADPDKNDDPRGAASDAGGNKLWVIDKDKLVYVYNAAGTVVGAWKAKDIGGEAEGIAVDPDPNKTGLWIVERNTKKVFFYAAGKTQTSGELNSTSSFSLNLNDKVDTKNDHPKGITTDGVSLWVVDDDGGTEKVFKYAVQGTLLGSWEIGDNMLEEPRGITLDPSGGSTIWIVDNKSDKVYQFNNATAVISGSKTSDAWFALAADNADPEGIADPPPRAMSAASAPMNLPIVATAESDLPAVESGDTADAAFRFNPALFESWLPNDNRPDAGAGHDGRVFSIVQPAAGAFAPATVPTSQPDAHARDTLFALLGDESPAQNQSLADPFWDEDNDFHDRLSADQLSDEHLDAVFTDHVCHCLELKV